MEIARIGPRQLPMWTVGEHVRILKKMLCQGIEPMTFLTGQWMETKTYCGS